MSTVAPRTADPYRDLLVIDERAPRTNQTVVAIVTLLALVTGFWPLVALMGAQLVIGLTFGRRWCLPCLFYFEVLQPRFGQGPLEDARPPRFANIIGASVMGAATVAFLLGASTVGWVLTGLVALLATVAALTGFCTGCWMHRLIYGECEACDVPAA